MADQWNPKALDKEAIKRKLSEVVTLASKVHYASDKPPFGPLTADSISKDIKNIQFQARRMMNGIDYGSINVDLDYGELANSAQNIENTIGTDIPEYVEMIRKVEELYNDLDIGSLAMDTSRRKDEVRQQVEENERNKQSRKKSSKQSNKK